MKSNNVRLNGEAALHGIEHTHFHRMRSSVVRKNKTHLFIVLKVTKTNQLKVS